MEKVSKEHKEIIMDMIHKAGSPQTHETSWIDEKGKLSISKDKINIKRGKSSKARGAQFELKVRKDLESKGRVVDKWSNNIDLIERKIVPAKRKYNPFSRAMVIGTGFPDFISIKKIHEGAYSVIGVESKINGILSHIEKQKCAWYLKNGVFSEIWIAKAVRVGRKIEIEYDDFAEKYGKRFMSK
jgi:hypothetical protein